MGATAIYNYVAEVYFPKTKEALDIINNSSSWFFKQSSYHKVKKEHFVEKNVITKWKVTFIMPGKVGPDGKASPDDTIEKSIGELLASISDKLKALDPNREKMIGYILYRKGLFKLIEF